MYAGAAPRAAGSLCALHGSGGGVASGERNKETAQGEETGLCAEPCWLAPGRSKLTHKDKYVAPGACGSGLTLCAHCPIISHEFAL